MAPGLPVALYNVATVQVNQGDHRLREAVGGLERALALSMGPSWFANEWWLGTVGNIRSNLERYRRVAAALG